MSGIASRVHEFLHLNLLSHFQCHFFLSLVWTLYLQLLLSICWQQKSGADIAGGQLQETV